MITTTPVMQTSSIDNFLRTCPTSIIQRGRPSGFTCRITAMMKQRHTSKIVNPTTRPLSSKKPSALLSPQWSRSSEGVIQPQRFTMQSLMLTSSAACSWTWSISTIGFSEMSTCPDWKIKSMSSLKDMHVAVQPKYIITQKTTASTDTPLKRTSGEKLQGGSFSLSPNSNLVGARTPKEDIVEAMQNVAKQVKPMSKQKSPFKIGGWFKPRMRYINNR
mmetsp:Transcript_560/g.1915  ORF Transcript_560/g.1915 Transcript_560/m.1915 type:complete len:218 (-) Transcript_560:581-1234(-)